MLKSPILSTLTVMIVHSAEAQTTCEVIESQCDAVQTITVAGIELVDACVAVGQIETCHIENPVNECAVLEAHMTPDQGEACVQLSSQCSLWELGNCMETEFPIECVNGPEAVMDAVLQNRSFENFRENIVNDCGPQEADPSCSFQESFETIGASSRIINALSVSRVWWERTHRYHCSTGQAENTCEDLEQSPICRITAEDCQGENADGSCARRNLTYRCESDPAINLACAPVNTCIGEECGGEEEADTTPEFAQATAWLNFLQTAGEQNNCDARDDAELPVDETGEGSVFDVGDTGCDFGDTTETECVRWEDSGNGGAGDLRCVETRVIVTGSYGNDIDFQVFSGEANYCRFTAWWNCCNSSGFDACAQHEYDLRDQIAAKKTHYITTKCGHETWYGLCLHRRRHYCVYDSKFARVFQEQTNVQTGAQFRLGETPQCPGLTFEQMESLDVAEMDLTEVYDDMLGSADQPVEELLIQELQSQLDLVGGGVGDTFQ